MTSSEVGTFYQVTNESLSAIIAGLAINQQDRVLAVGGSGDQAFALLETAAKVSVVDSNPEQIELIKYRARMLKKGNYGEFLRASPTTNDIEEEDIFKRNIYFSDSKNVRLNNIKANIDSLEIIEARDVASSSWNDCFFTKVYLSNILSYELYDHGQFEKIGENIERTFSILSPQMALQSLVYLADYHRAFVEVAKHKKISDLQLHPSGFVLDNILTRKAVAIEREEAILSWDTAWVPAVFRKAA